MTALPAIVAALLAVTAAAPAEPPTTPEPPRFPQPTAPPEPPTTPEPPPAGAPDAVPPSTTTDAEIAPAPPSATPPDRKRDAPELSVAAGAEALSLEGVSATGAQARVAFSAPTAPGWGPRFHLVLNVFTGETEPGLAMASGSIGVEYWSDPSRLVRVGIGPDLGLVGYRRATTSRWAGDATAGVRAGAEFTLVRSPGVALVLGAHVAAHFGPWVSAAISLGSRFGR